MSNLDFNTPDMFSKLETLDAEALNLLPFGVVRMLPGGEVVDYNRYESELSGLNVDNVIGQNFFIQVAPCTNNFMVYHRYNETSELDAEIDYLFTYGMKPTQVKLRLIRAEAGPWYLLVKTA
jgi:photoactive yellow protein